MLRHSLWAVQAVAFVLAVMSASDAAFADGDGCWQEIQRYGMTEYEKTPCNVEEVCDLDAECVSYDSGNGYMICICDDFGNASACQVGFKPDGFLTQDPQGNWHPSGSAKCVQWTCVNQCHSLWAWNPDNSETLICNCP